LNESTATRHQRQRRRAQMASIVVGAGWLLIVSLTPMAGALAAWAGGTAMPVLAFAGVLAVSWELLALPVARFAAREDRRRSRSVAVSNIWPALVRDGAVGVVLAVLGAVMVTWLMARVGEWWWIAAGLVAAPALLLTTAVAGMALRTPAASRAVSRPALAARVSALAEQVCGRAIPVREWTDAGESASAVVTGIGPAGAILLSRDLAQDWPEAEVAVVVAHELAHHQRRDLWRKAALDGVVLTLSLGAADLAVGRTGGLVSLPWLTLVAWLVWWGLRPIRLVQSRAHERAADRLALAWTGTPEAFVSALKRMGARHLAEERPSTWARWFFHKHPTLDERLTAAEAAAARR
jgi:STE24 endopeptidase